MDAVGRNMTLRIAKDVRVSMATALILETKLDFQRKIRQVQSWRGIPNDLIINFDQTSFLYVITGYISLHEKDAKSLPLQGKGKKKQIARTFSVSMTGNFSQRN